MGFIAWHGIHLDRSVISIDNCLPTDLFAWKQQENNRCLFFFFAKQSEFRCSPSYLFDGSMLRWVQTFSSIDECRLDCRRACRSDEHDHLSRRVRAKWAMNTRSARWTHTHSYSFCTRRGKGMANARGRKVGLLCRNKCHAGSFRVLFTCLENVNGRSFVFTWISYQKRARRQ